MSDATPILVVLFGGIGLIAYKMWQDAKQQKAERAGNTPPPTPEAAARQWQQDNPSLFPDITARKPDGTRRLEITLTVPEGKVRYGIQLATLAFVTCLIFSAWQAFVETSVANLVVFAAVLLIGGTAYTGYRQQSLEATSPQPQLELYDEGLWTNTWELFIPYERLAGVHVERYQPPHGPAERALTLHVLLTGSEAAVPEERLKREAGISMFKDLVHFLVRGDDGQLTPPHEEALARIVELAEKHNARSGFRKPETTIFRAAPAAA